jgi:1-pyrroline-5-carboxylate dehydrogenase
MGSSLPRVTYSNIGTDFTGVQQVLTERIRRALTKLGQFHSNKIAGCSVEAGERYEATSPIDRRIVLGSFIRTDAAGVDAAVQAARMAGDEWGKTPWQERVKILRNIARKFESEKYDLAAFCLLEVGKSRMESIGEVEEAIDLIGYYCDEMERNNGYSVDLRRAVAQESTHDVLRPVGVFGVISPFNFPIALSVGMLTGALVGGNTTVFKPSPYAGLTASWIERMFREGGLPKGVLNVVSGDTVTGEAMLGHQGIDGFAFTGSYNVGMHILRTVAASHYSRPVIVEMGGKNPTYVSSQANLDSAVEGVMRSAFGLQGQKCSSGSKVYVHQDVLDKFTTMLVKRCAALTVDSPIDDEAFVGPVINEQAAARFRAACDEARRDGCILLGGERLTGGVYDHGAYLQPTIVGNLPPNHRINKEELFLPLLSIQSFTTLEEAVRDGNDVDYGLTAGIYTEDSAELQLFLDTAQAGALYANRASGATTGAWPGVQSFCGWKGSGATGKGGLGPFYVPQFMREQSWTLMNR